SGQMVHGRATREPDQQRNEDRRREKIQGIPVQTVNDSEIDAEYAGEANERAREPRSALVIIIVVSSSPCSLKRTWPRGSCTTGLLSKTSSIQVPPCLARRCRGCAMRTSGEECKKRQFRRFDGPGCACRCENTTP